jgi:hypothetical protein
MPLREDAHEPIQQSVHVDCPIEDAFRLFTDGFGEWWPLASYSNSGDDVEACVIEPWLGGRVFERTRSGEELLWGSIIEWNPPLCLRFTWDLSGRDDRTQVVDVRFNVDADGTRVTLIHSGWETPGVAVNALRMDCADMWSAVLKHFFSEFIGKEMLATV